MMTKRERMLSLLRTYVGPHLPSVLLLAALLLGTAGLQLVNPRILGGFVDTAIGRGAAARLVRSGVLYLLVGLGAQALSLGTTYVSSDLAWKATNSLRQDLAKHCLSLDMAFLKTLTPGQFIERIDGDVEQLANLFSQFLVRIASSVLLLVGIIVVLGYQDWRLGLGLIGFVAVALLTLMGMQNAAVSDSEKEREVSAEFYGFIEERLMALDDIRANGGGHHVMRGFTQALRRYTSACLRAWLKRANIWLTSFSLFCVGQTAALLAGLLLFYAQSMTVGEVFALTNYMAMLFGPIEQLARQLQDAQKAFASIERVDHILGVKREILDGPRDVLPDGPLALAFDAVDFHYEDSDERVLKDVSFRLEPGTQLGLLGRTGSGKTTLSRLVFRLYDATGGAVRLADADVREFTIGALRNRIGLVTQEVQIFDASVRDNLRLFDASVPDARLIEIITELGLSQWFESLPSGLDTLLGPQGHGLSAGEAQLLAFGRVFIKDPGLIVLDEPSSSLDQATEHLIDRTMDRLLANRTAIIIAHRLGTVQRVDQVLIMDGGRVAEYGPRQELAGNPASLFAELLRTGMEESIA